MGQQVRVVPQLVVGAKSVIRAIGTSEVDRVLVADDAPPTTTEAVRRIAFERGVPVLALPSARELGRRCGVDRPVAAAAELGAGYGGG